MEAIYSSETSALTRPTWHHIPEDSILHISATSWIRSDIIFRPYIFVYRYVPNNAYIVIPGELTYLKNFSYCCSLTIIVINKYVILSCDTIYFMNLLSLSLFKHRKTTFI
jgi:hypothetical protein